MKNHCFPWTLRFPVLFGAVLALSACGNDPSPDKKVSESVAVAEPEKKKKAGALLKAYYAQDVKWGQCELRSEEMKALLLQSPDIASRTQCADVTVPRDYSAPAEGDIKIGILRVASEQPLQDGEKRQSLFFNPGGPGADGRETSPLYLAHDIAQAQADANSGKSELSRLNSFDLIGFSPRGLGSSTQLSCEAPIVPASIVVSDNVESELQRVSLNIQATVDSCAKNPLTRHINTESTARDMDLIRAVVGAEKLNYIGTSYGTWLGPWYAGLFPERAGHMVLDSVMDFTSDYDWATAESSRGVQFSVKQWLAPNFERFRASQGNLQSVPPLDEIFNTLTAPLQRVVSNSLGFYISNKEDASHGTYTLLAAYALNTGLTPDAVARLTTYPIINQHISAKMDVLETRLRSLYETGTIDSEFNMTHEEEMTHLAVKCNDLRSESDVRRVFDRIQRRWGGQPVTGVDQTASYCAKWPFKPAYQKPGFGEIRKAGPMLLVQSEFDTVTPLAGVEATLRALPESRLITVKEHAKHGVFPSSSSCVNRPVVDFLVEGRLPEKHVNCTPPTS
jgi:pimeloyl-ACP methyl ester carboxylesterase